MAAKFLVVALTQAIFAQCVLSQAIRGPGIGPIGAYGAYGAAGCGCGAPAASGGGFPITSISPIAPTGISIISENTFEGPLIVGGSLPFLSTVALEGVLPSAGAGAVSYGCGSGSVGIVSEAPIATGIVGPAPYAAPAPFAPSLSPLSPGLAPLSPALSPYGAGILGAPGYGGIGLGCGCGVY